jgi:putative transposase
VKQVVEQGLSMTKALAIAGIAKSSYYYRSAGPRKGKAPSSHAWHCSGIKVTNEELVEKIRVILSGEFIDYGYKRTAHQLKRQGWIINIKKVYRLMGEHGLLYPVRKRTIGGKQYAEHTKPKPQYPFHIIEVDIKYVWLHWQRRHAYLVTFLCVQTRFSIVWDLGLTMKAKRIASLLEQALSHSIVAEVSGGQQVQLRIRTDNGPQFVAKKLSEACVKLGIYHEFIHPGTPQQNGHIEGFHSTVERLICQGYELRYLEDATQVFERFYDTYNYKRIMAGIGYRTPYEALYEWAVEHGKSLPSPEEMACKENNFSSNLTNNNNQSVLSSL